MGKKVLTMSTLGKTWIFDFDGTLVEHNGYKIGEDKWLPGAQEFLLLIPAQDYLLILTAREEEAREKTEKFLVENGIRFDKILFNMPMGERILLNDSKPSGLKMAYAVTPDRNEGMAEIEIIIDEKL